MGKPVFLIIFRRLFPLGTLRSHERQKNTERGDDDHPGHTCRGCQAVTTTWPNGMKW
ncbi:hypothetical protein ACIBO2_39495 [Nonomuraea sp. NPDC050022]|uniref:hypothetical protein n=1 Tax=unclassified Nonomuraea TaxID=2593643 RepID=UPI0033E3C85E